MNKMLDEGNKDSNYSNYQIYHNLLEAIRQKLSLKRYLDLLLFSSLKNSKKSKEILSILEGWHLIKIVSLVKPKTDYNGKLACNLLEILKLQQSEINQAYKIVLEKFSTEEFLKNSTKNINNCKMSANFCSFKHYCRIIN